jgi:Ca2+-binding EF-hand superfamily protein
VRNCLPFFLPSKLSLYSFRFNYLPHRLTHKLSFLSPLLYLCSANLNEGVLLASPIMLWYRRRGNRGSGVRLKPIVDVVVSEKQIDSALVIAGYTCLNKSTNKGTTTGRNCYLWIRRAFDQEEVDRDSIADIAVTAGYSKDLDNQVHKPPGRGFILVQGDLNKRAISGKNIFLWFRPLTQRNADKDWRYGVPDEERNYELECNARRAIRQFVSPADLNFSPRTVGPTDFAVLFNKHATSTSRMNRSKVGTLSVTQFNALLHEVGLNVNADDNKHLMHRIDVNNKGRISREEFLSFVQWNDDELDEVAVKIKDFFGARAGVSKKKVIKAIRQRFKRLDEDGDGVLDILEFGKMVQQVGIFLTEAELMRLRKRFDPNGDGMVGIDEFETVVISSEEPYKKQAVRVADATQALRNYILQCQQSANKKNAKDGVDSESAWLDLIRKHSRGVGGKPFPGFLDLEDVAQAVERLGIRLSQPETRMLIMRVRYVLFSSCLFSLFVFKRLNVFIPVSFLTLFLFA